MTELRADTLDLLYEFVRDVPERQLETVTALDAKLVQVFAVASVVAGLAGLSDGGSEVLVAALAAYGVCALASLYGLWVRSYGVVRHADVLYEEHWDDDPLDVKHAIVGKVAEVYPRNQVLIRRKRFAALIALAAAGLEVVLLMLAVIAA